MDRIISRTVTLQGAEIFRCFVLRASKISLIIPRTLLTIIKAHTDNYVKMDKKHRPELMYVSPL